MRLRFRLPFVRRLRGRHDLGAAVTGIPSMPVARPAAPPVPNPVVPQPVSPPAAPPAPAPEPALVVPVQARPVIPPRTYAPAPPLELSPELLDLGLVRLTAPPAGPSSLPPAISAPSGPRVELGFADGSLRTLDPSSSEAQALNDLVAQLTLGCPSPSAP